MMKVTILLVTMLLSLPAFASHRHHSSVNCTLFKIDPAASQSLRNPITPTASNQCKTRMSHGYPIPDPRCTPGAINPTITLKVLRNHQFRTSCVRNHATSEHEKYKTYHWYGIIHPRHNIGNAQVCELDHLVSLELGGADTLDNIFPQCGPSGVTLRFRYFKQKDIVENYLAKMVREGKMNLSDVQKGIARDWTQYLEVARKACLKGGCKL